MGACIPALLFSAVTNGGSLATFAWEYAVAYGVSSLVAAFALWAVLRVGLDGPQSQSVILAMGAGAANRVFLGFPVASIIIPDRATEVFAWVVFAEIAIVFPITSSLAMVVSPAHGSGVPQILRGLLVSPVSLGLIAGFVFLAFRMQLPIWLESAVASIVAAAPYVALFVIGGTLLQFRISRAGPRVAAVGGAKLVIHPLGVAIGFGVFFGWDEPVVRDAILFATMPLFLSYAVFAARYDFDDVAASAIVLSTLLGAVSVPVLLSFLF
jgi:malonate transporter